MFVRLLLLFTVVPLVELLILVKIGGIVGALPTITIVVATGALGAWLARLEGLRTLSALRQDLAEGRMPTERLVDGLLILLAGAVLLTPGLLTDAAGFFLLVPSGRRTVRRAVGRALRKRVSLDQPVVINAEWERDS